MRFNTANYLLRILGALTVMVSLLALRTDNFSNYTYESARRSAIQRSPVQVSNWQFENTENELKSLSSFQDSVLLIDFIYTKCPTICRALGSRYSQLQDAIDQNPDTNIQLLSVSIDPDFDTPKKLDLYRKAHQGKPGSWELVRPVNQSVLLDIIAQTGLRIIPDEFGGFAHSDSIHVIKNGKLISIKDWSSDELDQLIQIGSNT